ncbi:ras-domain-containing protein [Cylindrobasidium torrendii FP15055 ss-10]|uniref:Ras-domain-containing protein n=1 Tax=Cylindrobasidium torrendii FP15055 ss-10 TaxID=1314674 RepID=A0A0D7AUA8_9AGAR|nr:ras-domain-containing protein [Cylindrobasidium torrendii FP15055 ss-10]
MPSLNAKVVVVGPSGVGKTSLRSRYLTQRFLNGYRATIGADFVSKTVNVDTDTNVTLQIWDTAGQERFSSLSSAFFRGADAVILVYDVNKRETLDDLVKWWNVFRTGAEWENPADIGAVLVVGNKIDKGTPQVEEKDAQSFVSTLLEIPIPPKCISSPVRAHSPFQFGTMNTTRTALTIYHTPSSSFEDSGSDWATARSFVSAAPTFTTHGRSPSRDRRQRSLDGIVSAKHSLHRSSAESLDTITPFHVRESTARPYSPFSDQTQSPIPPSRPMSPLSRPLSPTLRPGAPFPHLLASAQSGLGVDEVFEFIARAIVTRENSRCSALLDETELDGGSMLRLASRGSMLRLGDAHEYGRGKKRNGSAGTCC